MGVNNSGLNLFAGIPPLEETTTGRVYFLGNSATFVPGGIVGVDDSGGYGDTPYRPFATLDYAVSRCTAARGDVIYVNPGHAETIATATALDVDISGVRIIGIGNGSNRPTFTIGTAATATFTISAANVTMKNVVVISALDGLNTAMTVTGADCTLDIEHRDTSATVEADIAITASGARFICKLRDIGFTTGDQREASISMNGVVGARIDIDYYGVLATAVVNFVTILCSDVEVRGTTYVSGITTGARNVVDTIGNSLWYMDVIDAAAGARYTGGSAAGVASDDISAVNTVLGTIASAAATGAVTATDVAMSYIKQLVTQTGLEADTDPISEILSGTAGITTWKTGAVPATGVSISEALRYYGEQIINGTGTALVANTSLYGLLGGATGHPAWPTAAGYANDVSIAEVLGYIQDAVRRGTGSALPANSSLNDHMEKTVTNTTAVLATGTTLFTIAGGPIEIVSLVARCVVGGDAQAATLQWSADPTDGAAATFSGASSSVANSAAGAMVILQGTALTTAPTLATTSVGLSMSGATPTLGIIVGAGIITSTVGSGPTTTGTWQHHMRYKPLSLGVTVS